jgi:hypothetical protein
MGFVASPSGVWIGGEGLTPPAGAVVGEVLVGFAHGEIGAGEIACLEGVERLFVEGAEVGFSALLPVCLPLGPTGRDPIDFESTRLDH